MPCYLTQIDMEGLAVFPLDRDPLFLLPSGERWLHWAQGSQTWVQDVRPGPGTGCGGRWRGRGTRAAPHRAGRVEGIGDRGHAQLMSAINEYESLDASQLVYEQRLVKSAEELAMMEQAARAADRVIERMRAVARPGIRERGSTRRCTAHS